MAGMTAPSAVPDRLVLRWIFRLAPSFANARNAPPATSLLNRGRPRLFIRLQVIVDDGAELARVRCSINLDAVYFINVDLRLKLKLPACGDRMAAGDPAVLKVETSAAMLV